MSKNPYSKRDGAGTDFVSKVHKDTYTAVDPTKFNLTGKTVLITGASKGIGRSSAISFAKAGASNIIIGARSSLDAVKNDVLGAAKAANRTAPNVLTLQMDVSSQDSVEDAARKVSEQFSSVDILINNAGYLEKWDAIADSDPKAWWTSWEVNVKGTYLPCRSFIPLVLQSDLKTILNVTSTGAHFMAAGASAYQTNKLAICRFTEFLMVEYGKQGLLAYCAHPGGVETELARGMPEHMMELLVDTPELAADTFVAWTEKRRQWWGGRFLRVNWDLPEFEKKEEEVVKEDLLKVRLDVGGIA